MNIVRGAQARVKKCALLCLYLRIGYQCRATRSIKILQSNLNADVSEQLLADPSAIRDTNRTPAAPEQALSDGLELGVVLEQNTRRYALIDNQAPVSPILDAS